ncbi:conserved hypothetical protein [Leishmania braziliensis MHOM/BR/75/M2904]|uniref:Uncharacterized protein n=2 Tax=Leishmania braziliensis TaxID=5660 RepID=A4HLK2_LEIBR|nr:conserved hypothetical protein [Leishmania braziliensis MHOM/BR/75/M2904]CAJ2479460.1 unnamed protein product [Leishmania braziliensis]CAM40698.2 conserved hypothetical protein [Leishmania braziliensis MHOM/BR/75/M2904]SYZ69106.1 WD_domain [Leishmania braziliensis MHOM/BR/75/M2904]
MPMDLSVTVPSPTPAPQWLQDIENQLLIRNAVELKPSQLIFDSYTTLHASVLHLQAVEDERQQLRMEQSRLTERVRELERAAANTSVQTSRERELEAKKDALQDQLQLYTQRESDYYKGLAEMTALKEKKEKLELRSSKLEAELEQRTAELQLLHKEYTSLRDEYSRVRLTVSEADRYLRDVKTANEKIAQLQYRIVALESEVNMLRRRLQAALQGDIAAAVDENASANANEDGEGTAMTPSPICRNSSLHTDPHTAISSNSLGAEPSRASMIIPEAHSGSTLHGLCVLDDGKHFLTSGTDKHIRLWNRQSAQAEKYFSSNSIALALDSSSHYLLAGCADHVVRFWDLNSLRALEMTGHTEKVVAACLSFSAQHAFTASSDSTIKLWDIRRRESLRTLLCQSTCNDVTVVGDTVFSAHYNGKITVWDRRTATRSGEVVAHQRVATCVRVSANGMLCVSMGKDNIISVRDARVFTKVLFSTAPEQLTVMMNWARLAIAPTGHLCAVGSGRSSDLLLIRLDGRGQGDAEATDSTSSPASVKVLKAFVPGSPSYSNQDSGSIKGPIFSTAWGANEGGPLVSISDDHSVQVWE